MQPQPLYTPYPLAACKDRLASKGYRYTVIRKDGKTTCLCTPCTHLPNASPHAASQNQ